MNARKSLTLCVALALLAVALLIPAGAQADFGIKSFTATSTDGGGTPVFQAGSHSFDYTINVEMKLDSDGHPGATLRDLIVDLPPGLVGNPLAVPRCTGAQFEGPIPSCPGNTQIGIVHPKVRGFPFLVFPVYNMTPPLGVPGSLGFSAFNFNSFQEASVRSSGDYGLSVADITIPTGLEIQSITETIWGVPADPSHDAERQCFDPKGNVIEGCDSDVAPVPFLSLPTACRGPVKTTLSVDSVENPGVFDSKTVLSGEDEGAPTGFDGCNALEFKPTISSQPTTNLADSPTGLDFNLHQPQNENPDDLSTAHLKDTTVTLPRGMTLNPSAGNGLQACSNAQIGYQPSGGEIHFSKDPQSCPNASKVGTLEVSSPPVDHRLPGAVYVAKPYENPLGSLLAIYLAVEDEQTGIVAKLAGKVTPDPQSGQLTATFKDNPQLPIEDIDLHIFGGPRGALKTPFTCGTHTTSSTLTPWSTPEGADATPSDSFATSVAPNGGPCPTSEAAAPKAPSFTAGTLAPQAAAYSPFLLKLTRPDGSQQLTGLNATLPKGLTGKLAGIPYCSEAQIAQAKGREQPNQGAVEQASPSCPLASEVGTVTVGAGAGITPLYVSGHAYLAGPYKGAPISLVIITPAVAGPFDLGAVVVRTALQVNSETAQIHAVSDPLPSILQGIPLDLRSISLRMDRPDFTLNPTSCDPTAITGAAATLAGQSAALTSPFQLGGCSALKFKPKLAVSLKGATKRTGHPALRAVLTYPKGQNANASFIQATLPHSAFLDTTHIKTICTRVQFAADQCPKGAIYGSARAFTPLLDKPLEGPVYLRSSSNKLPDLVLALKGQVEVDVVGRVDTGKGDGIRNTFEASPDAPISKVILEMKGGKKGLLVNSENICSKPQRAIASYKAHNGDTYEATPLIKNDCGKKGKKKGKARR